MGSIQSGINRILGITVAGIAGMKLLKSKSTEDKLIKKVSPQTEKLSAYEELMKGKESSQEERPNSSEEIGIQKGYTGNARTVGNEVPPEENIRNAISDAQNPYIESRLRSFSRLQNRIEARKFQNQEIKRFENQETNFGGKVKDLPPIIREQVLKELMKG